MKYTPGLMVGQLSGKAGNTVASRNRYGSYFRTRTIPINPDTTKQTEARGLFADLAATWRLASEAERTAWAAFAANYTRTDSLGNLIQMSGMNAFMIVNLNLNLTGGTTVFTPPPYVTISIPTPTLTIVGATSVSLAFSPSPLATGRKMLIYLTRPLSDGVNFAGKSQMKLVSVSAAAATSPLDLTAAYTTCFGALPATGEKVLGRIRVVSSTGLDSAEAYFQGTSS